MCVCVNFSTSHGVGNLVIGWKRPYGVVYVFFDVLDSV